MDGNSFPNGLISVKTNDSVKERRTSVSSSTTTGCESGYASIPGNMFLEQRNIKGYDNNHDFIYAMTEDLAEWFNYLYDRHITVETFLEDLANGVLLCEHALEVQHAGEQYVQTCGTRKLALKAGTRQLIIPTCAPIFRSRAQPCTFLARDNIANFISWCKSFGIPDYLCFETEDLVLGKNVKNVILCLLEIARIGAKLGMEVPDLIRMEEEIDAEIEEDLILDYPVSECSNETLPEIVPSNSYECSKHNDTVISDVLVNKFDANNRLESSNKGKFQIEEHPSLDLSNVVSKYMNFSKNLKPRPKNSQVQCDLKSLDDLVRELVMECKCQCTFPMKRLQEGKYQFGDNNMLIFVRVLRSHVMVRVGGGWDTLRDFLGKHDPCRRNKECRHESTVNSNNSCHNTPLISSAHSLSKQPQVNQVLCPLPTDIKNIHFKYSNVSNPYNNNGNSNNYHHSALMPLKIVISGKTVGNHEFPKTILSDVETKKMCVTKNDENSFSTTTQESKQMSETLANKQSQIILDPSSCNANATDCVVKEINDNTNDSDNLRNANASSNSQSNGVIDSSFSLIKNLKIYASRIPTRIKNSNSSNNDVKASTNNSDLNSITLASPVKVNGTVGQNISAHMRKSSFVRKSSVSSNSSAPTVALSRSKFSSSARTSPKNNKNNA